MSDSNKPPDSLTTPKSDFIRSRRKMTTPDTYSAYSDKDLREMFGPYLTDASLKGLSPVESRLLETVLELKEKLESA